MSSIRYALAALYFTASVGCLALWGLIAARPNSAHFAIFVLYPLTIEVQFCDGEAKIALLRRFRRTVSGLVRTFSTGVLDGVYPTQFGRTIKYQTNGFRSVFFPLRFPALMFALAGIGVLRFRRQFSIRSTLIATTVVAVLIAMAVTL